MAPSTALAAPYSRRVEIGGIWWRLKTCVEAIRTGDLTPLRERIRNEPDLARVPRLIVEAARKANDAAVALLLEQGADPNAIDRGYRPLHALVQERRKDQLRAGEARTDVLERLLTAGADPRLPGAYPPAGALLIAAFDGGADLAHRLVRAVGTLDPFSLAALLDRESVLQALARDTRLALDRNATGLTLLQCCVASRLGRGDAGMARVQLQLAGELLAAGADPNARAQGWTEEVDTVFFPIAAHDVPLTTLLLDRGADPTRALPWTLWNGTHELAELALSRGARIDDARHAGRPLLNALVNTGRVNDALWLLERGASADVPGAEGWTALHHAASRGNRRVVEALLAAGADARRTDFQGHTPCDVARKRGRAEIAAALS